MDLMNKIRENKTLYSVVAIGVAWMVFEYAVLAGEVIEQRSLVLGKQPVPIEVERVGETHTVALRSTRRSGAKKQEYRFEYVLKDADGRVIVDGGRVVKATTASFDFTPTEAGTYYLSAEDSSLAARKSSVRLKVYVNDHRLLTRYL